MHIFQYYDEVSDPVLEIHLLKISSKSKGISPAPDY